MTAPTEPTAAAAFTLVFAGDLRKFPTNPHHVDTPFGRPIASGIGNAFEIMDALPASPPPSEADAALVAEARRWISPRSIEEPSRGRLVNLMDRLAARLQAAPPAEWSTDAPRSKQPVVDLEAMFGAPTASLPAEAPGWPTVEEIAEIFVEHVDITREDFLEPIPAEERAQHGPTIRKVMVNAMHGTREAANIILARFPQPQGAGNHASAFHQVAAHARDESSYPGGTRRDALLAIAEWAEEQAAECAGSLPDEGWEARLDEQLYEFKRRARFDPHDDDDWEVTLTAKQWRQIEYRLASVPPAPAGLAGREGVRDEQWTVFVCAVCGKEDCDGHVIDAPPPEAGGKELRELVTLHDIALSGKRPGVRWKLAWEAARLALAGASHD